MTLNDAQVERFSRQIILPEIGGVGQARLLASAVAVGGSGAAAQTAARYLTGAGIGRLLLCGSDLHGMASELAGIDPAAGIVTVAGALGGVEADVIVAADAAAAEVDAAIGCGRPLVAGGSRGAAGWVVAAPHGVPCAGCASRRFAAAPDQGPVPLAPVAAGVIGALLALRTLAELLGLPGAGTGMGLHFDAELSTVKALPPGRATDCRRCTAG